VTLRISAASWIRPALALDFGATVRGDVASALRLGLSSAAWEGPDAWEPWYGLRASERPRPATGTPRGDGGWVLAEHGPAEEAAGVLRSRLDRQVHGFEGAPRPGSAVEVRWRKKPSIVAWVLGRSEGVVASPGPLAYDALRCGLAVHGPDGQPLAGEETPWSDETSGWTFAPVHVVSPLMQRSAALWPAIVERLLHIQQGGHAIAPLMSPQLVAQVRDHHAEGQSRHPSKVELFQRRTRKLFRDPEAFLHDSHYRPLRALGRVMSAETSRCPRQSAGRWVRRT